MPPIPIEARRRSTAANLAALTLANALVFQEELAQNEKRVDPIRKLLDQRDFQTALANHWKHICDTINYIPIFRLAREEERLYLLDAWRESPLYTDRERAALAWTEALTLIAGTHAPDDVFDELKPHFKDDEIVKLTVLIGAINTWNRISIGFRSIHPVKATAAA